MASTENIWTAWTSIIKLMNQEKPEYWWNYIWLPRMRNSLEQRWNTQDELYLLAQEVLNNQGKQDVTK